MLPEDKDKERDVENGSSKDLDKQRLVESGKQFLKTLYSEKEEKEISEVEKGKSYFIREKKRGRGLELSLRLMEEEGNGYILSSMNSKKIKREYEVPDASISYNWLTTLDGENRFDPSNLHLIGHSMIEFLEKKNGPIFMEGVEIILKRNSFNRFLRCINHLVDVVSEEKGIFVLSLNPVILSDHRLSVIEQKLERL